MKIRIKNMSRDSNFKDIHDYKMVTAEELSRVTEKMQETKF